MAVLFGKTRLIDGLIIVGSTSYYDANGNMATLDNKAAGYHKYLDGGYEFDAETMPNLENPEDGYDYVLLFNPSTLKFIWESTPRPLTQVEQLRKNISDMDLIISGLPISKDADITVSSNDAGALKNLISEIKAADLNNLR